MSNIVSDLPIGNWLSFHTSEICVESYVKRLRRVRVGPGRRTRACCCKHGKDRSPSGPTARLLALSVNCMRHFSSARRLAGPPPARHPFAVRFDWCAAVLVLLLPSTSMVPSSRQSRGAAGTRDQDAQTGRPQRCGGASSDFQRSGGASGDYQTYQPAPHATAIPLGAWAGIRWYSVIH